MPETIHRNTDSESDLFVFNSIKAHIIKAYKVPRFTELELRKLNDHNMTQSVGNFIWIELSDHSLIWIEHCMEIRYNPTKDGFECTLQWIKFFQDKTEYDIYRRNALFKAPEDGRQIPPDMQN